MNATSSTFRIRYWGVTGSFANPLPPHIIERKLLDTLRQLCALPEFTRRAAEFSVDPEALERFVRHQIPFANRSTFGGNTTCLEIQSPETLIIIDAGSGLRRLGEELTRRWNAPEFRGDRAAHVLLTHAHMDHTFATPFFEPYYDRRNCFQVWGPRKVLRSLNAVLSPSSSLRSTFFPLTYELMEGLDRFTTISDDEDFMIGDIRIRTLPLCHPGDCLAYRLDVGQRSIAVVTDHELSSFPDPELIEFCQGVDLLYIDAQYLRAEYDGESSIAEEPPQSRRGWGHGTVEAVIEMAIASGARRIRLGHHDPKRTDECLAGIEEFARRYLETTLTRHNLPLDQCQLSLAREGLQEEI